MFSHFTRNGKCEWFQGGLVEFIHNYNHECGTSYTLTKCLDVERTGGATPKMPEVLLTDRTSERRMVVEHKSVVWPPEYIRRHENEHAFAEAIWQATSGWYQDACYELIVLASQMDKLNSRKKVMKVAHDIASAISPAQGFTVPTRCSVPVKWRFRRTNFYEFEQRKGIVVVHLDNASFPDFSDETAMAGTTAVMQEQLNAASAKFHDYTNALRVVLLEFYGTDLDEEDIPALMPTVLVPPNIDEVWMRKRDWTSEDDFEIGYARLFQRTTFLPIRP